MQGTGKFVIPSQYFDTPRNYDPMEKDKSKLEDWLAKYDAAIEELWKKIRRKSRHSDIGSSNTLMKSDYRHDGDLEMNAKANAVDEQEVLHKLFCSI